MRRPLSIRIRLTLWYGVVMAAILIAFSSSVYLLMRHHLLALTDAGLSEELTELADEVGRVQSIDELEPRYSLHEGYELQVATADGRLLFRGARLGSASFPVLDQGLSHGTTKFQTLSLERLGRMRLASRRAISPFGPLIVQAATSLDLFAEASRELLTILLLTGTIGVGCSIGVGYMLALKAMAPVDRMVSEAAEITASRLDRRLEVPDAGDELARLARTLNDMIERLERSFTRVRQFTADAAHELRTPLAVIRSSAEVALREPRSPDRDGRVFEDLVEEADRLGRIVSQLLELCREDNGMTNATHRSLRLDELAYEVVDLMQVAADEKGVSLELARLAPYSVMGDADRLRQLLINLIDNSLKYTRAGGSVTIRVDISDSAVCLEVADNGIGIPPEHLPHVLERFYRVDSSRCREEGTGLGLAICRSIAEAHQGQLRISSEVGRGTIVGFTLPRAGRMML